jgi:hypothetical protein
MVFDCDSLVGGSELRSEVTHWDTCIRAGRTLTYRAVTAMPACVFDSFSYTCVLTRLCVCVCVCVRASACWS